MSSMFPCISDSPSRTNVLTIIFLLVAPRCRDVCNVCQHEWWAVGSTRVASTRGMPLSMHISPSLLPSFARPCQDHEELIGAFLLSCAPGQARARRRPASAAAAAAATTTVAAAAVTTTAMAAEVSKCGCGCVHTRAWTATAATAATTAGLQAAGCASLRLVVVVDDVVRCAYATCARHALTCAWRV